jgi:hypothetical protein
MHIISTVIYCIQIQKISQAESHMNRINQLDHSTVTLFARCEVDPRRCHEITAI